MYYSHYRDKLTTPEDAVERIASGATIIHGSTTAEPPALLAAIADRVRRNDLKDIKVFSLLPLKAASETILSPDLADRIHAYAWFVSSGNRGLVQRGLDYFVPNNFHEIPRLCRDFMEIDVTVTTVSPMDKAGFFSFGTVNDYTSTAARHCKTLIVEVNKHMPRVFGDSLLHVSEVDAIVENDVPLVEISPAQSRPDDEIIGRRIAEMIPDGATIQLGIGSIPDAAARYLDGHRDLGIHTEVFCPAMVELITKGVITGRKKSLHPRKHIFTNALGTREMYEFMHENRSIESYPVSHTNDPSVIRQNDNMISINSTIEVDLMGQCNSEYMAGSVFSGSGGQLDYVRGAFHSRGGMSIIAFRSTVKDGAISRVIPNLDEQAAVTVPRMDTHYLITEHGMTMLKGKSTRERALGIISLAHPRFRDDLLKEAEKRHLI